MREAVNIICLYWKGEFRGRDFTEWDVWRLYAQVKNNIDREFQFFVLTNDKESDLPGTAIMLKHKWPGWWSKVELHRGDLPLQGRKTLYLDLDTTVTGNLGRLFDYPTDSDLVMFDSRMSSSKRKRGVVLRYQAAVMLFDPGANIEIYNRFKRNARKWMGKYRSEQDIMGDWIPNKDTFPHDWMMKLSQFKNSTIKRYNDTIIITGQPKGVDFRQYVA